MESTTKRGRIYPSLIIINFRKLFFSRNNKRVAEIWLDEYKKYFYARHPDRYRDLDIGDISQQVALKQKLNCKPFSYFLEHVAPDLLERFPLEDFPHFASGTVGMIRW